MLTNGEAELTLTQLEGDQKIGIAANVLVTGIDELFQKYLSRGLDQSHKKIHLCTSHRSIKVGEVANFT
jgi:hypothetical protein